MKTTLLLLCLILAGCTIGPRQLKGNRLSYNVSIQKSDNEELLLNFVRLRYMEVPCFMQVSSVTSSFEYSLALQAEAQWSRGDFYTQFPIRRLTPFVRGGYAENPTISYSPLSGEKFVSQLLTEITPHRFWFLHRSGWEIDLLLDVLVRKIGPLNNPDPFEHDDPKAIEAEKRFNQFARLLHEIQGRDDFALVYNAPTEKEPYDLVMELRFKNPGEVSSFEALLGTRLKPTKLPDGRLLAQVFLNTKVGFKEPESCLEGPVLRVRFRNFIGVLVHLLNGVETPPKDVEQGIVRRTITSPEDPSLGIGRIVVHCVTAFPSNSFAAIRYRGQCFYISDNDFLSKRTFAFVVTLFSLQSGDVKPTTPVLTLPVGAVGR